MAEENQQNPNVEATPQPPDNPTAGESKTPEVSKQEAPSTSDSSATPMASASKPDKEPNHDQSDKEKKKPAAKKPAGDKPAAKKKKEKPPKPEDKPFQEFIHEEFTPALKSAFAEQGIEDIELSFAKEPLPAAFGQSEECWQVMGNWQNGQRGFNIYFLEEDIKGQKAFSYTANGGKPSTLESFMIDERRVNLDLLVLYTLQRLNGQKWLARN